MELTKKTVLQVLAAGKPFKFVESEKEVDLYYNQKKYYAVKKDSEILKELVRELDKEPVKTLVNDGKFPIDDRILNMQRGYYHIIDIYQIEREIKSQIKVEDMAYALYRKNETGDFWNKIYQIRLQPLINFVSTQFLGSDNSISDINGKTIYVSSFNYNEEAHSYKVSWEGVEEIEIHINKNEYESQYLEKIEEEELWEKMEYENQLIEEELSKAMSDENLVIETTEYENHLMDEIEKELQDEATNEVIHTKYFTAKPISDDDELFQNYKHGEDDDLSSLE